MTLLSLLLLLLCYLCSATTASAWKFKKASMINKLDVLNKLKPIAATVLISFTANNIVVDNYIHSYYNNERTMYATTTNNNDNKSYNNPKINYINNESKDVNRNSDNSNIYNSINGDDGNTIVSKIRNSLVISKVNAKEFSELEDDEQLSMKKSIENILRVTKSLKFIQNDINGEGTPESIISQIKFLINNYKLKDNINNSLLIINKNKLNINSNSYSGNNGYSYCKEHGSNAVENLVQVYEYYSDEIDNFSGKKFPPKEVLMFALEATKATDKELKILLDCYPADIMSELDQKISKEYEYVVDSK